MLFVRGGFSFGWSVVRGASADLADTGDSVVLISPQAQ